jgi:hypothetical protein
MTLNPSLSKHNERDLTSSSDNTNPGFFDPMFDCVSESGYYARNNPKQTAAIYVLLLVIGLLIAWYVRGRAVEQERIMQEHVKWKGVHGDPEKRGLDLEPQFTDDEVRMSSTEPADMYWRIGSTNPR